MVQILGIVMFGIALLAPGASVAELQGATLGLRGGHLNAGSHALLEPALGSPSPVGSAGGTLGPGQPTGTSAGSLTLEGGFWPVHSASLAGIGGVDTDADGIADALDNCLLISNPVQLDVDFDGYGNACDADYNNDGGVGGLDFSRFRPAFGAVLGSPLYDVVLDHNGDGGIGSLDWQVLSRSFGGPPGPSGLACAGAAPCP